MSNNRVIRSSSEKKILNILSLDHSQKFQKKCFDHIEEDLHFICYDCDNKTLCIECVSNGTHKGH